MKRTTNLSKPPGTRKSPDAWKISIREGLNPSPSKKHGADSHQLSNDPAAILVASSGSRGGRGSVTLGPDRRRGPQRIQIERQNFSPFTRARQILILCFWGIRDAQFR